MATHSKVTLGDELRQLENGIKTNLNDVQSLVIDGTTYTIPELLTHVDGFISVQDAATKAKNDFHTAVTAEKASYSAARTFSASR